MDALRIVISQRLSTWVTLCGSGSNRPCPGIFADDIWSLPVALQSLDVVENNVDDEER